MKREAKKFINDLKDIKDYWVGVSEKDPTYTTARICEGLVFSILSYIDGCSGASYGITLIDDQGVVINDQEDLHDNYYR